MTKDDKKANTPNDYDPKLEARIDEMMSEDDKPNQNNNSKNEPKKEPEKTDSSASAPLLPGEELPKFDEESSSKAKPKAKQPEKPAETTEKEEKPAVLGGLVNNIPKQKEDNTQEANEYLESEETSEAVDEIVSNESDRMLAIEDAKAEMLADGSAEIDDGGLSGKIKRFFTSKAFKIVFFTALVLGLAAAFAYPDSRYYILNKAGVRASTSLKVVDEQTNQPLKDATVTLGDVSTVSDPEGNVTLNEIMLGEQEMSIAKPAFADVNKQVTIGWGSNPMGELGLVATGTRYTFKITDFLSGKPLDTAEAASGEASAKADEKGEIVLVVSEDEAETIEAEISAEGYRTETINLKIGDESVKELALVPSRKHAFVSNRDGNFGLYKIDVDGKNEEKILDGTGNEREEEISILAHPDQDIIAFVSTRTDERTASGEPIGSLHIIDLNDNSAEEIAKSERIQLIEFIDNRLIYVKIQPNVSEDNKRRHRIISYDLDSGTEQELASSNYFNDVLAAAGLVYYSPAEYQVNGSVGFYRIHPDGSEKVTVLAEEAWNLFRVGYDKINIAISEEWYQYDINTTQLNQLNGSPPTLKSRIYTASPNSQKAAWTDIRDGKGVLLIHNTETGEDEIIQRQSGLVNPVSWIGDKHIVYRVATGSETADYVVNINGGEAKKIVDVTNTVGLDRFYLY